MSRRILRAILATALVGFLLLGGTAGAAVTFTRTPVRAPADRYSELPATDGEWIVWQERSTIGDDDLDLWAKNLRTGAMGPWLTGNSAIDDKDQTDADISMDRVVYEQHTSDTNSDIAGVDLRTGAAAPLAFSADDEVGPRISGSIVIWLNKTRNELVYGDLRTLTIGTSIPSPAGNISSWDVDRGRIAFVAGTEGDYVWLLRPGLDPEPVLFLEAGPNQHFHGVRLHGDTIAIVFDDVVPIDGHLVPFRGLSVLNVRSGSGITQLSDEMYGHLTAVPFHTSVAWDHGGTFMSNDVEWEEALSEGGDSAITVAGTEATEWGPALFGRRIVWQQMLLPDTQRDIYMGAATPESTRTAGADRYATAAAVSAAYYGKATEAVLCTGLNFPDALAAAPFAQMVDGPLLLAATGSVPTVTMKELKRLGVTKVYVIGGPRTLTPAIESALGAEGIVTERIAGATRYDTANEIAERIVAKATDAGGYRGTAFFARGDAFPDALAVGPVACQARAPIVLVQPDALPSGVADAIASLNVKRGYVIGGEGAVSAGAKSAIDSLLVANGGSATTRWSGANRYATAVAVTNGGIAQRWIDLDTLGVATGENFPDALGGGTALGYYGSGLVLTRSAVVPSEVASFLSAHEYEVGRLDVLGGTAAVGETVKTGITARLR